DQVAARPAHAPPDEEKHCEPEKTRDEQGGPIIFVSQPATRRIFGAAEAIANMGFADPIVELDRATSGRVHDPGPCEDQEKKEEPLPPEQSKISVEVERPQGTQRAE